MDFKRLLHGGDYNPDQWLDQPEILEEDIKLMKKAHVNCVSLGIFSWALLEPSENHYEVEWLRNIIDNLYKEGIYTILATPSGAMPNWLTNQYPSVMQTMENGIRNIPGKRHNFCYTSKKMREKTYQMDAHLSKELGNHPGVILWHISNELGGNFHDGACYCEECQEAFREWLKKKYETLDALNKAWWTRFWSHVYTDWSQIHSPAPNGENILHGLNLDWKRFTTYQMTDFCKGEIQAVRTYSDRPVTTNFMDFFKNLDYYKLHQCLDIVSWDSYPLWHSSTDEVPVAVRTAANHTMMRSMKKKPFLLMESTPSLVNWREINSMKRPGMHLLSSMQAVAHGSDSVQYFQWRKGRGSFEKFHGAVVGHKGGENTRVFRDVTAVGCFLEQWQDTILDSCNQPKVAMIFDWENWWALEDAAGPRSDMQYPELFLTHFRPFWEAGIDVDIICPEEFIQEENTQYRLVVAPYQYLYQPGYADAVESYVKKGGTFVTTCFSGIVNETDLCFTDKHPLQAVLGIEQEEMDAPFEAFPNTILWEKTGEEFAAGSLREVVTLLTAKPMGVYTTDYCKGCAAVTQNEYGNGKAYYLAAEGNYEFLKAFYGQLLEEKGIRNPLGIELPYGVTVSSRKKENGEEILFLQNYNNSEVKLTLQKPEQAEMTLEPYAIRILLA